MKKILAVAVLVLVLATPALAAEPRILDSDSGYGRASASSWSRGYGHIAFIARYSGKAEAFTLVRCQNGFRDREWWDDGGPRFRYVVRVPRYVRCVQDFWLRTNGSYIRLAIGAF